MCLRLRLRLVRLVGLFVFFYPTEREGEGGEEPEGDSVKRSKHLLVLKNSTYYVLYCYSSKQLLKERGELKCVC